MDFWQALAAHYDAAPALALAGGLHKDFNPDKPPTFPYGVFFQVGAAADEHDFEGRSPSFIEVTFQVSIFATSEAEAHALIKAWTRGPSGLDSAELPVSDGKLLALLRAAGPYVRRDPDRSPKGDDVFIGEADYTATLEEE